MGVVFERCLGIVIWFFLRVWRRSFVEVRVGCEGVFLFFFCIWCFVVWFFVEVYCVCIFYGEGVFGFWCLWLGVDGFLCVGLVLVCIIGCYEGVVFIVYNFRSFGNCCLVFSL